MCSQITQNGRKSHIKGKTPTLGFIGKDGIVEARWRGFARVEKLKQTWIAGGIGELVRVPAQSYEERGKTFTVPEGKALLGVVLIKKRFDYPVGTLLLVTRSAITDDEAKVHSRHPFFVSAA